MTDANILPATNDDAVLDVEVEDPTPDPTPAFRVVSHKPGVLYPMSGFGGVQDMGVTVDPDTAAATLWWMAPDWAVQVLRAGIELPQLTAPTPGFIAGLDSKWLHRQVGTLRLRDIPNFYVKHPDYLQSHPQVVVSTPGEHAELVPPRVIPAADLAAGAAPGFEHLGEDTLLQIDEMLPCVVEVRVWIADGEVVAFCPYRIGMVGWDSALFLEMLVDAQGQKLTSEMVENARLLAAEVDGPPGYALDLGATLEGTCTVLRAWPAWSADPLGADPVGVFRALQAAHDFDGTGSSWRWTPDLAIYDRSFLDSAPETEAPQPDEDEESEDDHG